MSDWTGPRELVGIEGDVDAAERIVAEQSATGYRSMITLVNVVQTYDDGPTQELETRTLYIPEEGQNAMAFAASVRKAANLPLRDSSGKKTAILPALRGRHAVISVVSDEVQFKDGTIHPVTTYRVTSLSGEAKVVTEDEVIAYLKGKTPAEARNGRAAFTGTPYADLLVSQAKVTANFGGRVKLEGGRYAVA